MYEKYYDNQVGGGTEYPYSYTVSNYQRGGGIGGFLAGLSRTIFPFIGRALRPVGRELLTSGLGVLGDVISRRSNFRDSVDRRMTESGNALKRKALASLDSVLHHGGGEYKTKRRRKSSQKGSGRGAGQTKKQKGRGKNKIKKRKKKSSCKIKKKKPVKRRKKNSAKKKKPVKRDLYDVFS